MKKYISLCIRVEKIAHHPVPGINTQLQCIGIKPDHVLVQSQGRSEDTADLVQGTFTQITRCITDPEHDHVQKPEAHHPVQGIGI